MVTPGDSLSPTLAGMPHWSKLFGEKAGTLLSQSCFSWYASLVSHWPQSVILQRLSPALAGMPHW